MRKFFSNIGRAFKELTLPLWMCLRRKATYEPLSGKRDGLVVSLTTMPKRIYGLWVVMDSLFRQTVRPDRIILVLTEEEFPVGKESLPESLLRFCPLGLEIVFLPYNLRCHNKYIYSLGSCPGATVITVDDDCYYRRDTIERLVDLHRKYPGAVCCNIAGIIDPNHFYEYSFWKKSSSEREPSDLNVALGFAGVLYPSEIQDVELFLDRNLSKRLAPTADDLWLKACELVSGIKVASGPFFPKPVTISGSQKVSLRSVNKGVMNRNDTQWKSLDVHFSLRSRI